MQSLGDRIKFLREKKNMTQKDLAAAAGLTVVQLSRYETGDRKPDPEALRGIADALDSSADYLLGRTEAPSESYDKGASLSFYGGPEAYTSDEIAMMEAALKAYREQKKKLLDGGSENPKN
ncbi:helix-turn-helix domain-containing protein [Paenibacillus sp. alder61]|uniref:Helix-turn-helix transcriptional regulator n=1 Tax=Paenibacillus faecis TaxID=862114 RepID=A0A5D0CS64_9BACL|nr:MULTISPECIES: helix-turn-helix transcriptional regulator [Paenibacillus]MCA1293693.1 helix-turn-helix domain-containing protein [Paenibacillus sp. alder61]TYA12801.1 helix-turn-helix transcriptional regulator [Paenibacillus faecis]